MKTIELPSLDTIRRFAAVRNEPVEASPKKVYETKLYPCDIRRDAERAANIAKGLRWDGKPLKNKRHPELAGLDRRTYHRLIMRMWRGKSEAAPRLAA